MPPPPGFGDGYSAQFDLGINGYAVVLPTALLVAMLASGLPASRAARGALSRALTVSAVVIALLPGIASAGDHLERADAAWAVPAEQVCSVDAQVTNGTVEVSWELQMQRGQTLGYSSNLAEDRAQAFWHTGTTTWFQTASMRRPLELSGGQSLVGGLPLVVLLGRPLVEQWVVTHEDGDTISVDARPDVDGPYASAVLVFVGDRLTEGSFAGPSGRVLHTATWSWTDETVRIEVVDATARGGTWVVDASRPVCAAGELHASRDRLGELLYGAEGSAEPAP